KIYKTVIFDNVKVPSNLKKKGEEYLKTAQYEKMVLELKAIDLNFVNEGNQELRVGDKIRCISAPNGMDKEFPLTKKWIYITQFKKNTVTL
ncbi:phage tail protein, partial [Acinetobacter baumannii]|uniref:phage tail protein n=1 Tax=Acinetobacter baumannii TaxID=470 RepID=UPI0031F3F53D